MRPGAKEEGIALMRCPDCNKFVSYDTDVEPEEIDALELNSAGELTGEFRRVLTCQDCSQELKELTFSISESVEVPEGCEHEFEVSVHAEATTNIQATDMRGNPIKNPRYMKTLYGIEFNGKATCSNCNCSVDINLTVEEAASNFEELV